MEHYSESIEVLKKFEEEINDRIYVFYTVEERLPTLEEMIDEVEWARESEDVLPKNYKEKTQDVLQQTRKWLEEKKRGNRKTS